MPDEIAVRNGQDGVDEIRIGQSIPWDGSSESTATLQGQLYDAVNLALAALAGGGRYD